MLSPETKEFIACSFLLLILVLPAIYWVVGFFDSPFTVVRYCLSCTCNTISRMIWRVQIDKKLPIPYGQGVMLVTNHRSSVDPFFIQIASNRVVHWMVAREFVEHPLFSWFLKQAGAIGTNRGGRDTKAIREAINLLKSGETIGILPEGRINMTSDFLLPIRPGAAMIALKAKVPIVPLYIEGAPYNRVAHSPFFMPALVKVKMGDPIDLSEFWDEEMNEKTYRKVMLKAIHQIAQLAEQTDYQPVFAGRNWKPTEEELQAAYKSADELRKKS